MGEEMTDQELRGILFTILKTQIEQSNSIGTLMADVEALRTVLPVAVPEVTEPLGRALVAARDKYAKVIQQQQVILQLLLEGVSETIH